MCLKMFKRVQKRFLLEVLRRLPKFMKILNKLKIPNNTLWQQSTYTWEPEKWNWKNKNLSDGNLTLVGFVLLFS